MVQHCLLRHIPEIHVVVHNIAGQLRIGRRSLCLMVMLPRPHSGPLRRFGQLAVLHLCVHQCNITLIHLGFFIEHRVNTVRACHCHNNEVKLLADLIDRHVEALIKCKETSQLAKRQSADSRKGKRAANHSHKDIADIPNLRVRGHKYVRVCVCFARAVKQLIV